MLSQKAGFPSFLWLKSWILWGRFGMGSRQRKELCIKKKSPNYWLINNVVLKEDKPEIILRPLVKSMYGGFPGGAVAESLPANAGDTGSSPGLGRSHVPRGNWARGPQLLSLRVWSLCSATREAAMMRVPCTAMKSGPRLPQLETALTRKRRPNTAINKINK